MANSIFISVTNYLRDQIKTDEMGRICTCYYISERWEKHTRLQSENTKQGGNTGDIGIKKIKLRDHSPQANYTDRATAACRRS
jgi:hypothetical protein